MKKYAILLMALFLGSSTYLFSQNDNHNHNANSDQEVIRCYTTEVDAARRAADPQLGTLNDFENWLAPLVQQYKDQQSQGGNRMAVTTIPIIFHVIHDGESVGSGDNLSATYINAQIDQLNNDFRRIAGTSGYNTDSRGADSEIEFCAAVVDPNGNTLAEPGINRINRSSKGWSSPPYNDSYVENTIKGQSYWDPNDYCNVWVVDLSGGLLGYAQFPNSSGLGGLNSNNGGASTDGVVVLTSSVGSSVTPNPGGGVYDEGRTLTHELGHFFGLRHIWGDANCGNDYCGDTPAASGSASGCPNKTTCDGQRDMVENYMDYSYDNCMNIYTGDQKARMQTVLANSPRRDYSASTACSGGGGGGPTCGTTISSFPYSEGFESGTGAWSQASGDDLDWTRDSGGTPSSNTGPSSGNGGSTWYMYVETSSPNYPSKTAILDGPCLDLSSATQCTFDFAYHMYGSAMGTLAMQTRPDGSSTWTTQWTLSGDQGNAWNSASVNLNAFAGSTVQVRFLGTSGTSWAGDMTVDDISITTTGGGGGNTGCTGGISSFPYSESFESGFGAWNQASGDDFDWSRDSGGTPSSNTGPSSGSAGAWYLYCESSSPNYSNKTSFLVSDCFDLTGETQATFTFDYHMYGAAAMGGLELSVSKDNGTTWTSVWSESGNQGNSWQSASVNLDAYAGESIQFWFNGTTGTTWQGDMAIDNIGLTTSGGGGGGCTDVTVTINTDQYPGETTWSITDGGGSTVASGGPYSTANGNESATVCLDASGCNYTFTINDSYGDGICCGYGNGSYTVTANGSTLASGSSFTSSESTTFCPSSARFANQASQQLSVVTEGLSGLEVYPNPTNGLLNLRFKGKSMEDAVVRVMDVMGKTLHVENMDLYTDGIQEHRLNVRELPQGTYLVRIELGTVTISERFVVAK